MTGESKDNIIIVTGMHRSGTSLTANLLNSAGVDMGTEYLPPKFDNPRGYFEDTEFVSFHQEAMAHRSMDIFENIDMSVVLNSQEIQTAKNIIKQREKNSLWGWKDPRTVLFLDAWNQVLPSARFLFIYRHPVEVFFSLINRASDPVLLQKPLKGLSAWEIYNQKILAFIQAHEERCTLCHIHGILANGPEFLSLIQRRLSINDEPDISGIYTPELLRHFPIPEYLDLFLKEKFPNVARIYTLLEEIAHLQQPIKIPSLNEDMVKFLTYTCEAAHNFHRQLITSFQTSLDSSIGTSGRLSQFFASFGIVTSKSTLLNALRQPYKKLKSFVMKPKG